MTVQELIGLLKAANPEATVFVPTRNDGSWGDMYEPLEEVFIHQNPDGSTYVNLNN